MQPVPDDLHPDDREQWLLQGIFLIRINGELSPAIMCDRGGYLPDGMFIVQSQHDGWLGQHAVTNAMAFTHWPMCGAINPDGSPFAVIVERLPRKQFTRTFAPSLCKIRIPRHQEMIKKYGHEVVRSFNTWTPPIVKALFDPVYPTYRQARALLEERSSVALSPLLMIVRDDFGKSVIHYRGRPAATISNGGHTKLLSKAVSAGVIAELLNERE